MRLVIFDADGTLVDSEAIIHKAMQLTFDQFGLPHPTHDQVLSAIGLTLNLVFAKLLARPVDDEIESMCSFYKSTSYEMAKDPANHAVMYEGISEVLNKLSQEPETLLGIATGKSSRGLNSMINIHNLSDKLIAWRSADDCPSKPHPAMILEICDIAGISPQQTVMVGDASFDMEMAVNAGAKALGVSWGYQPVSTLNKTGADMIVDNPSQIPDAIDALLKRD